MTSKTSSRRLSHSFSLVWLTVLRNLRHPDVFFEYAGENKRAAFGLKMTHLARSVGRLRVCVSYMFGL